jgi:hypothetical protein
MLNSLTGDFLKDQAAKVAAFFLFD